MAVAGIQLNINTDELRSLRDNIRAFFPKAQAAEVLGEAIEKAIWPAFLRLREVTPVGPTGNLKRAVNYKIVKYKQSGVAVGLIGYNRAGAGDASSAAGGSVLAGPDRAFHQWWLEFGTKERIIDKPTQPKSYSRSGYSKPGSSRREHPVSGYVRQQNGKSISVPAHRRKAHPVSAHAVGAHTVTPVKAVYYASSYNELGPFRIEKSRGAKGFTTNPAYPKAFFKKSSTPIRIPAMPAGGEAGRPPVQTAWDQTQAQVAEYLQRELSLTLGQAWAALRFRNEGSVTGTDTLGPG
jgi:hypothetical protein